MSNTANIHWYLIVVGVAQFVFDKGTFCFTRSRVDVFNNAVQHFQCFINQLNVGMSSWCLQ